MFLTFSDDLWPSEKLIFQKIVLYRDKKCKFLGCHKADLKTVLYCQNCLYGVYNVQKPQNFQGAAPPDPCRSSIGALTRTSLARSAALRAASRVTKRGQRASRAS